MALTVDYDMGFATLTSNSSWSHHDNHTSSDLTNLYSYFPFYPRCTVRIRACWSPVTTNSTTSPGRRRSGWPPRPAGSSTGSPALYYKDQKTNIQEHEFYPGYLDYFNACVPTYGVSNGDGVTPSQCGIGETVYNANPLTYVDGIPIVKDQAYIGDFETTFRDIAVFGELTAHLTSAWSVTGGTRLFKQTLSQAQQTGLLFDGGPDLRSPTFAERFVERALWKINTLLSARQDQSGLCDLVAGVSPRQRQRAAAQRAGVGYTTHAGLTGSAPDTAEQLRSRRQGDDSQPVPLLGGCLRHPVAQHAGGRTAHPARAARQR